MTKAGRIAAKITSMMQKSIKYKTFLVCFGCADQNRFCWTFWTSGTFQSSTSIALVSRGRTGGRGTGGTLRERFLNRGNPGRSVCWRRRIRRRRMKEGGVVSGRWAWWWGGGGTNPSSPLARTATGEEGEGGRRTGRQCAAAGRVCSSAGRRRVSGARRRPQWRRRRASPCSAAADCPAAWRCRGRGRRWTGARPCARARAPPACWLSASGGRSGRTGTGCPGGGPGSGPGAPVAPETTSGRCGSGARRCSAPARLPRQQAELCWRRQEGWRGIWKSAGLTTQTGAETQREDLTRTQLLFNQFKPFKPFIFVNLLRYFN